MSSSGGCKMSELAVFARQVDISRSSSKTQKRPLSIIRENDSDIPETGDYPKYQECADSSSLQNTSVCEDTCESNQNKIVRNEISEASDQAEPQIHQTSFSGDKLSSESSLVTVQPNLIGTQSSLHSTKSTRYTSSARLSGASASIWGLRPSNYQSENSGDRIPDETCLKLQSKKTKLPRLIISENQHSKQHYSQHVSNNDVPASCDITQTNITTVWPKSSGDGQSMTRVRETTERLNLLSTLSPTSPAPLSATLNSKFGHRLWTPTWTPRTLHQPKSPVGPNYQQLSLTANGGTPLVVSLALATSPDSDDISENNSSRFLSDIIDNNSRFLSDISDNSNSLSQSSVNRSNIFSNSKLNSSKLSSYFSRRLSNESTGSLSESDLSDGDIGPDDASQKYLSYFRRLKETTDRLRLSTRRPSIMLWRQQYMECQETSGGKSGQNGDASDDRLTLDRKQRIDLALDWLRNQLQEMRSQDQNLARQLLAIRNDIHKLKLQRSTEEHQELIDDFHFELQELQELSDVLDLPLPEYADNPLKHIGVTRLNISARRFSAC